MKNNYNIWYQEEQRFKQTWVIMLLLVLLGIILIGCVKGILTGNHHETIVSVLAGLIVSGIGYLLTILRLRVYLDDDGLTYQFFPFHLRLHRIAWSTTQAAYVRRYRPLTEFGGWGMRVGMQGTAYTTSGKYGIQLVMKSGKRVLFGTQQPQLVEKLLRTHQRWQQPNE